jgi:ABC-type transporter Mla subunit MlaD
MHGIDVGTVISVRHAEDLKDPRIHVLVKVVRSEALRLRTGGYAKVVNKGLLGDKMLEFIPGSTGKLVIETGLRLRGEDPTDFSNLVSQVEPIAEKTNKVLTNLKS